MSSSPAPPLAQARPTLEPLRQAALKQAAFSDDEPTRVRVAAAPTTPPELLYFLASDQSLPVRVAVACNPATPAKADTCLTRDPDDRVRMVLARKLATLTPALTEADQRRLAQHAWDNLAILVSDEVERVRALVADLVKDMPDAPRTLILRLARDASCAVSGPVLRLSPTLTQEDLLALLACPPAPHLAQTIACRAELSEAVCDAIATSADTPAIRCLLQNTSASIREATLDALTERATAQIDWHEPLVRRPALSAKSARLLSTIVADRLARVLAGRDDLDPAVVADLRARLTRRAAETAGPPARESQGRRVVWGGSGGDRPSGSGPGAGGEAPRRDEMITEAVRLGDVDRAATLLAVAADVPAEAVQRAARLRSAKAAVSLVWKAGLSMRAAIPVQSGLCNLPPSAMLRATADGGFPLSRDEMLWQIEFLTRADP